MTRTELDNSMDVIDSRDVIERITELEEWRDAAIESLREHRERIGEIEGIASTDKLTDDLQDELDQLNRLIWTAEDGVEYGDTVDWSQTEASELKVLLALQEEGESSPDWPHGETLIRDSYFVQYAQELADDIGATKGNESWPLNCIDWDKAAKELQYDYTCIDFDGVEYWIRS